MHLLFLYADSDSEWNCAEWRCKIPSDSINSEHEAGRTKHTAQLIHLPSALDYHHPKVQQVLGKADAIHFQRNVITPDVWQVMDYWKALGKIIVVDCDDAYPSLPPSNPAHRYWILNAGNMPMEPVEALKEGMRHADALTAPSKILLSDWSNIVSGFYVPNWPRRAWYEMCNPKPLGVADIEFTYIPNEEKKSMEFNGKFRENSEGLIILGWGGSISHVDSWIYSGAIGALDRLFEKYPNLRLKWCGYESRLDYLLERWGDRVIRQPGVRPEHWPFVVSTFDVGLAPLDMRPTTSNTGKEGEVMWDGGKYSYDERRSWLKGVEYLAAGIPWVATRSATYEGIAHHGSMVENSMTDEAQRIENWFKALDAMIQGLPTRKLLAAEKKKWALKKMTMEGNVSNFVETYERIGNVKNTKKASLPGVTWYKPAVPQKVPTSVPSIT